MGGGDDYWKDGKAELRSVLAARGKSAVARGCVRAGFCCGTGEQANRKDCGLIKPAGSGGGHYGTVCCCWHGSGAFEYKARHSYAIIRTAVRDTIAEHR